MVTDNFKQDLTAIKAAIEMAFGPEDTDTPPTSGWTLRDTVSNFGPYTLLVSKLVTPTAEGRYKLWGRWTVVPETVTLQFGLFQVLA
jgi:hypothetical protein